jgi:hypothetical protein
MKKVDLWPEVFWTDTGHTWDGKAPLSLMGWSSLDYDGRVWCLGIVSKGYTLIRTYVKKDTPKEKQDEILQVLEDVVRTRGGG